MKGFTALALLATIVAPGVAAAQDAVDVEARTAQETLRKLQLENEKQVLDNASAARTAEEARLKAIADAFPTSPTTGAIAAKDGAGQMEADALAALAVNAVADDIARETRAVAAAAPAAPATQPARACTELPLVRPVAPVTGPAPVLMIAGDDKLSFARWEQFRFRSCKIAGDFSKAIADANAALGRVRAEGGGGGPLTIGTAVTIASKLLQLLTPDWELGGVKVDISDRALMTAVARAYVAPGQVAAAPLYWAGQVSKLGGGEDVFGSLGKLDELAATAELRLAELAPKVEAAQKALDKVTEDPKATEPQKAAAQAELQKWSRPAEALKAVATAHQQLLIHLNGKEGEALLPVNQVVQEASAARLLGDRGLTLSLSVQRSGGGYYTRKVIWNAIGIGGPPYFVSGGIVADYALIRPSDQQVLAAGLFACNAGYLQVTRVSTSVNRPDSAAPEACRPASAAAVLGGGRR